MVWIWHFDEQFTIRSDSATQPDGTILSVQRKIMKLMHDTYHSGFDNCPSHSSSKPATKRKKPEERRVEQGLRDKTTVHLMSGLTGTKLFHLLIHGIWKCAPDDSCIQFYKFFSCSTAAAIQMWDIKPVKEFTTAWFLSFVDYLFNAINSLNRQILSLRLW